MCLEGVGEGFEYVQNMLYEILKELIKYYVRINHKFIGSVQAFISEEN